MYQSSKNNKRSPTPFLIIIFTFALIMYSFYIIENSIQPIVMTMAEYRAKAVAVNAINNAIKDKLSDDIQYRDLIFIKTDSEGSITLMQANTIEMNKLASETALEVLDSLWDVSTETIRVPLGAIFNSQIFAHYGPKLKIQVSPAGTVVVDFKTEFEEAGINQTRHKIYLMVKAEMQVVIPFAKSGIEVVSNVPIAETLIIGRVPQTYISVPEKEMINAMPKGQ